MSLQNHKSEARRNEVSEICSFYAGKTVFITGASGFIGTVLLEFLLRCCPDISEIYILLRSKKGVQAKDRKDMIFKKTIFDKLKITNPDALKKVIVVPGDISEKNLGLTEHDYKALIKDVNVVFHVAAITSYLKPLRYMVRHNVLGTSYMIDFCRKMQNLEVFVYTSSTFACCNQKHLIEEKVYELPFSAEELIKHERNFDDNELMRLYNMCTPPFPNFYVFSKCVAENLLKEKANDLNVSIVRPSTVMSCFKEPLPGYIEEGSAVVNLPIAVGKGFVHVCLLDEEKRMEIIPADVVASTHAVVAFHQASKSLHSPSVYNCTVGELGVNRWGDFIKSTLAASASHPITDSYFYPVIFCCKSLMMYNVLTFLLHYIPAAMIDLITLNRFRLVKMYKFYDKMMNLVQSTSMHQWVLENKNFQSLFHGLNPLDKEIFSMDLKDFNLYTIMEDITMTYRDFLLNGKPYKEKIGWKFMRYFTSSLFLSVFLGSPVLFLYVVLVNMIW